MLESISLKPALVQVAHAVVKDKQNPYYTLKYERIAKRRGKRIIIAIAKMILIVIHSMLATGESRNPIVDLFKVDMLKASQRAETSKGRKAGAIRFLENYWLHLGNQ